MSKSEYLKQWRAKNKDRVRAFDRARYAACDKPMRRAQERARYAATRENNHERRLCKMAKSRAKILGLPFDIAPSDISIPEVCPALGMPLRRGHGVASDWSPTLDRIIPSLGYVKGNVRVISMKANRIKSDATPEEVGNVHAYMLSCQSGG